MCAIVDVNNCYKIFGNPEQRTPAGSYFLNWLEGESGRLILGGTKFNSEIGKVWDYVVWLKTATRTGHAHRVGDHLVDAAAQELNQYQGGMCISWVLTKTERTPRHLISPLGPNCVGTDSAVWRYVHFTLALV